MSGPMVRVVVAPGRRVRIDPHPSGLEGMAPLYVDAGEGLTVSDAVADQLYRRGDVLHPQTGQPRPAEIFRTPPLVTKSSETFESLAARADAERTLEAAVPSRGSDAVDGWRDHVSVEPEDPNTAEQMINVGERRWQW